MSDRGGGATKIDLRQLRAERGGVLVVACREKVASRIDEIPFVEPVEGSLTLVNLGPVLRVDGRLHTPIDVVCDLCATRFSYRLEAVVDEELHWDPTTGPHGPAAEDSGEFLVHVGENVFLDVEALARDVLVLALPMVHRCSPECRGLCPRCGANLRLDPCRCAAEADAEAADPRLQALVGWYKDHPSSGSAV